jgi:cyclophilin family peptidyl-prolyl cis-trans isomerase
MMNIQLNGKYVHEASLESHAELPTTATNSSRKSSVSDDDAGTSSAESSPTKASLEWLKAKREWWKESQQSKLVEYPASEGNEIVKAQQALDLLCAIQEGKADASTLFPAIDSSAKPQGNKVQSSPEISTSDNHFRDRLVAFYEKYNPSKLSTVDETLKKYHGKEDEMFRKLEAKYAMDPYLPATGTGPKCFMEFSTGGRVTFELFHDKVPFAAENFRSLCTGETGASYRNCVAHRIVPNFCIQAGDYTKGDGTGGRSIYPKASPAHPKTDMWGNFEDETPFLRHDAPGLLCMANNGPNRNSSQFFITLRPLPHLNGKHVVFGRVTQGMDVVEALSRLETNSKTQRPIELLCITDYGEIEAEATASSKQGKGKPSNETVPTSDWTACDIDAPSFSLSMPNSNGSLFEPVLPFDSATCLKSNHEGTTS